MALLVGLHGIGQQLRGRHQLLAGWRPAIADGLEGATGTRWAPPELDIAFYGDLFGPAGDGSTKSGATAEADVQRDLAALDDAELTELAAGLAELVPADRIAGAERTPTKGLRRFPLPLQAVMRAVDREFGAGSAVLWLGRLRQVRRYLGEADVRRLVDERVHGAVPPGCRVLIGHSLGSVVAHEYLRRSTGHRVELLVTLGSPLALRMVRRRLTVGPVPVPAWVNIYDPRDPVACAGGLRSHWPQIAPEDEIDVDNGARDVHAVEHYLSQRQTGRALLRVLSAQPAVT